MRTLRRSPRPHRLHHVAIPRRSDEDIKTKAMDWAISYALRSLVGAMKTYAKDYTNVVLNTLRSLRPDRMGAAARCAAAGSRPTSRRTAPWTAPSSSSAAPTWPPTVQSPLN
jgi:hypothetical protein